MAVLCVRDEGECLHCYQIIRTVVASACQKGDQARSMCAVDMKEVGEYKKLTGQWQIAIHGDPHFNYYRELPSSGSASRHPVSAWPRD